MNKKIYVPIPIPVPILVKEKKKIIKKRNYGLCKICGLKQATYRHIISHKISYEDYLKHYEPIKYYRKEVIKTFNKLYITVRYKYIEMNCIGEYRTNIATFKSEYLNDKILQEHLEKKYTIGIFPMPLTSQFLIFDIDSLDFNITRAVYEALAKYVLQDKIYISYSGNKGYHISIFFDKQISKKTLNKFYELILLETGFNKSVVECRGHSDSGVKLPLGLNFKNNKSNNFCEFLNYNSVPIGNELDNYKYFLDTQQIESSLIYEATDSFIEATEVGLAGFTNKEVETIQELKEKTKVFDKYKGDLKIKLKEIETIRNNGIQEKGTRYINTFYIALYNKDILSIDIEANREHLRGWTYNICNRNLYKSNAKTIEYDIISITQDIYENDKTLFIKSKEQYKELTTSEAREILSVNEKLKHLYFILFTHCKAYTISKKNGQFFMSYKQISMSGFSKNGNTIRKGLKQLEALNKIKIINPKNKDNSKKRIATTFIINFIANNNIDTSQERIFYICNRNCKDCFNRACVYLLDKTEALAYGLDIRKIKKNKCKNTLNKT